MIVAKRLALQHSRRYRATRHGRVTDLRRSFRKNIKYGGTLIELTYKRRKLRKPRIVLLCDVSRSMETYSTFLLQFIYALQNTLGHVESFVFSTRLTRVTDYFKAGDIHVALERMARDVPDWAGGTRIGDSLVSFNKLWALRIVDRHTIVLILSDGLDSGDAAAGRDGVPSECRFVPRQQDGAVHVRDAAGGWELSRDAQERQRERSDRAGDRGH